MPVTVELSVSEDVDSGDSDIPDDDSFRFWVESACLTADVVASLQVVGRDEMCELNKTYRGKNEPTNVLSFPMQIPGDINNNILGDLALCVDVIVEEAKAQGKTTQAHWAHMVVHGMLHLQGYDHIQDSDADIMEKMEIGILKNLGYSNPYSLH